MAEEPSSGSGDGAAADNGGSEKSIATMAGDFHRTLLSSTHSALHSTSSFQDSIPKFKSLYRTYEDAFFNKVKDELMRARENPAAAFGVAVTAGLFLMRGPRRFLFRHTLGRLQSEEAQFVRAEKNVKELNLSVDLMKKESRKLLERTALAEKDMQRGRSELMNIGGQIQHVAKSVYKVEAQAADLMDGLREIPSREALKLRAEVASMASFLKRQRIALDKRIMKVSELGVPV